MSVFQTISAYVEVLGYSHAPSWYARPQTGVSDGFPWGQLTATGVHDMIRVGADQLGHGGRPDRFMFRAAGEDVAVQTAQALAVGVASASGSTHVAEVLLTRCEELDPALHPDEYAPSRAAVEAIGVKEKARDINRMVETATKAIHARFPDSAPTTHTRESLCELLTCLNDSPLVDIEMSNIIGNYRFAEWTAPFHADASAAMDVFGPLFCDVFRSLEDAADDLASDAKWPDEDTRIYVVPAETLVGLAGTIGLAPELLNRARQLDDKHLLGAWPSRGARLDIELVGDPSSEPCVRFEWNGRAVVPWAGSDVVPWVTLRKQFTAFLE